MTTTSRAATTCTARTALASLGLQLQPRSIGVLLLLTAPLLLSLAALPSVAWSQGSTQQGAPLDPPGRVARLSLTEGAVSLAPADSFGQAGDNVWTPATLNRPLTSGDKLWTGPRARSELHIGSTAVRMSEQTSLDFLALDDNVTQLRLAQGSLKLRVRNLYEGQRLEVNTPNLAFVITQPGDYRLDVNPASDVTRVVAQSGGGVIYGDNGATVNLGSHQQASYSGTQLSPAGPGASQQDGFDAWAAARDRRENRSISARYVPRETIGYQELDNYGDWNQDPSYGAVWLPRAVPVNWAPYRAGHWDWISPWGWTWVDDAPWGFAPFHYDRWAQIGPRWAWVPGRLAARPVYAPALVAFVGGSSGGVNWNISIGSRGQPQPAVGWFPLAPGEAYRPAYLASPRYITQVNQNIVVNNTVNVTNVYRYQRQPAAVTAVSREDFARGRPLRGSMQALSVVDLNRAQVVREHAALPQRPERSERPERRRDERERPRPLAAAALPPIALAARPVVASRDEHRQERRDDKRPDEKRGDNRLNGADDARRAGRPDNGERNGRAQLPVPAPAAAVGLMGAQPPTQKPAPATPPAALPAQSPPTERSAQEAEQRARREQPQLQREQQRQQRDLARQQGAQREQPPKNGSAAPAPAEVARAAQERQAGEQAQRAQQLQREQQQQQRQPSEAAQGQRAQREQAQKQQVADQAAQARQQQEKQQQQQQQVQRDQQRQSEAAHAQGQRAQREQVQKQQAAAQAAQAQQLQQRAQQDQQRQAREQQRQQTEQVRHQEQQRQQNEAAQGQRALHEQAQRQQAAAQAQQQQQRAQQDQQRQAREQPKPPPQEQARTPDPERQKKRRADAANAAGGPQPEGDPNRNR